MIARSLFKHGGVPREDDVRATEKIFAPASNFRTTVPAEEDDLDDSPEEFSTVLLKTMWKRAAANSEIAGQCGAYCSLH